MALLLPVGLAAFTKTIPSMTPLSKVPKIVWMGNKIIPSIHNGEGARTPNPVVVWTSIENKNELAKSSIPITHCSWSLQKIDQT